jgi:DNA-binding beta-propeller fold protein YncE
MRNWKITILLVLFGAGCGREPSGLLRQSQLPIYDFPLYLSQGADGKIWQIDRKGNMTLIAEDLADPRGIATDRFGNVYVAEYGSGQIVKINPSSKEKEVVAQDLLSPSTVAVDSFGEVYVTQDGASNVVRASDSKVFGTYPSLPTALTFGVDDIPIIGLYDENKIMWGWDTDSSHAVITAPVNASLDGTGRIYVAEGEGNGRVIRYHQREPSGATVVANNLLAPTGIAVDPVGNIFVVEQGASRIVLISFDGIKYEWIADLNDPQYVAFSQY